MPIDDIVKPVVQLRPSTQYISGIGIDVGCTFAAETNGDGSRGCVAQYYARGPGIRILRAL